jgi:hypothetical protein
LNTGGHGEGITKLAVNLCKRLKKIDLLRIWRGFVFAGSEEAFFKGAALFVRPVSGTTGQLRYFLSSFEELTLRRRKSKAIIQRARNINDTNLTCCSF